MSIKTLLANTPKDWCDIYVNSIKTTNDANNTTFDRFEEKYVLTGTVSGPWGAPQACNIELTVIGDRVFVYLPPVNAVNAVAATIANDVVFPTRFRPLLTQQGAMLVVDNSITVYGRYSINSVGVLTIGVGAAGGIFGGAGTDGFPASNFSYTIG